MAIPRLPVGQTWSGMQAILHRVARPDLPRSRKVLAVAWPVVVANLFQSLALTVDLIMVGALGAVALAATGVATQVFFLWMALGTGLAAGATALVARAFGAGNLEDANRSLTVCLLATLLLSLPLVVVSYAFDEGLLRLLGADESILEQGSLVLRILAFGIPGQMLVNSAGGALQGAGDTRPALVVGILVNVVNLVLDYALIFGRFGAPELGIAGAAVATTLSFTLGGLVFVAWLALGRRPLKPRLRELHFSATLKRLARVGLPAGVEQVALSLGFTAYLVIILHFGADALAAHQIGLRVQGFAFMPGFGFAAAAAALVGQGLGRGDPDEAARNGWTAIGMGFAVMMLASVVLFAFAGPLARLFTDSPQVLDLGVSWIHVLVFAMPAIAFHFGAAGGLRGAGDTRWPLAVSFVGLWLVRLPLAWLLGVHLGWGMYGVWTGYIVEYYGRALVTTWRFWRGGWKTVTV